MADAKAWVADQPLVEDPGDGAAAIIARTPRRKIHPLVRLDYPVRLVAHFWCGLVLSQMATVNGRSDRAVRGLGSVVAHVAYPCIRSRDSKKYELLN